MSSWFEVNQDDYEIIFKNFGVFTLCHSSDLCVTCLCYMLFIGQHVFNLSFVFMFCFVNILFSVCFFYDRKSHQKRCKATVLGSTLKYRKENTPFSEKNVFPE